MDYFYHYTTAKNWEEIQKEGLIPDSSVTGDVDGSTSSLDDKPAIFGLPSPAPKSWLTHNVTRLGHSISILEQLLRSVGSGKGLVLLKVRLSPKDKVYVGDYKSLWETYDNPGHTYQAFREYAKSISKLKGPFGIAAKKLPEILVLNPIPASRIELVAEIPDATREELHAYVEAQKEKTGNENIAAVLPQQAHSRFKNLRARFARHPA